MAGPVVKGIGGGGILLLLYFLVLSSLSGWSGAVDQFSAYWYFVIALSAGFGVQIGLYTYLRAIYREGSKGVLAVSGTASTAAMVSCCTHYLANLLPLIATAGIVTLVGQYQVELFWFGILLNLIGTTYMGYRIYAVRRITTGREVR